MKYKLLSLLFAVAWLSASAKAERDSVLCTIEHDVAEAQVHVRACGKQWSLLWDYLNANNYRMATIKLLSADGGDNLFDYVSSVTVSCITDGKTTSSQTINVPHHTLKSSIKISVTDNTVRLSAGDGTRCPAEKTLMHFDGIPGSKIIFRQDKSAKQISITNAVKYRVAADFAQFEDREQLDQYLSASRDSIEGYWQYLDRNIDAPNTVLGGYYELATVRNGDGYVIIYLRGADKYSTRWEEMQIKGRLKRTIFKDNFDLQWIDSRREQTYTRDVYATFEQNAIMSLHFPLLNSEVRFSRKPR